MERIHLRVRAKAALQARLQDRADLALLVLKTALDLTPVCLPTPAALGVAVPRLASGAVGLVGFSSVSC